MWARRTRQLLQVDKIEKMEHFYTYTYYIFGIHVPLLGVYKHVYIYIYTHTHIYRHMFIHMVSGQDEFSTSFEDDHGSKHVNAAKQSHFNWRLPEQPGASENLYMY